MDSALARPNTGGLGSIGDLFQAAIEPAGVEVSVRGPRSRVLGYDAAFREPG